MKLKTVFKIIQGHQITDEELYRTRGGIPVLTGKNQIKGYWNKQLVSGEDLPCISYPTKANSGEVYVQNKVFDANNTAVLIPYPEWREQLNLDWTAHKISRIFLGVQTSKGGVSYLNREIVEELEVDIPKRVVQDAQYATISKLIKYSEEINKIIEKISKIKSMNLVNQYRNYQAKQIPIKTFIGCMSGNSGLTEHEIYNKSQGKGKRFAVLTSSADKESVLGYTPKDFINGREMRVFEGKEGILVVRVGNAGANRFLEQGDYTITENAYILYLRDDCSYRVSLKWLIINCKSDFSEYGKIAEYGAWNMTGFFENVVIDIPSYDEQQQIVREYDKLESYGERLKKIQDKIDILFSKTIV